MEAKAVTRYLRVAPRKIRLVIDAVRGKPVVQAFSVLRNLKKKSSRLVEKTLKSAQANAKGKKMDENRLYVSRIFADGGPTLKRYMPRSMGRADVILKRTSHLTVILGELRNAPAALKPPAGKLPEAGKSPLKRKKQKEALAAR